MKSQIESEMDQAQYDVFINQVRGESENMWITDLFVDKPCLPIGSCYCWLFVCAIITQLAGYCVPVLGGDRDYNIWMHPVQIDADKYNLALKQIEDNQGIPIQDQQTEFGELIFILYEQTEDVTIEKDGNKTYSGKGLLDIEFVRKMIEMERKLMQDERFKKFCLAAIPAAGDDGKNPVCLESALNSGARTLAQGIDPTPLTLDQLYEKV